MDQIIYILHNANLVNMFKDKTDKYLSQVSYTLMKILFNFNPCSLKGTYAFACMLHSAHVPYKATTIKQVYLNLA